MNACLIEADFINVPGQESITVACVENDPADDAGAKLDLGHFALFFSTEDATQFDFEGAVSDAIDAIPIGGSVSKTFDPLQLTVEHPTSAKWQFKVDQSA